MKITKFHFRTLLIASVLFDLAGGASFLIVNPSIPPELQKFVCSPPDAAMSPHTSDIIGLQVLVTAIVVVVGFFVFWRPARILAIVLTLETIIGTAFLGTAIQPGWAVSLSLLSDLLWGAILTLTFVPPLKDFFEK